jgi:acetyl esterase/lipase
MKVRKVKAPSSIFAFIMVFVRSLPAYSFKSTDFVPGQRNGWLSEKDPQYVAEEATISGSMEMIWELPLKEFRECWNSVPSVPPQDCPKPGVDVLISDKDVWIDNENLVRIKIYKSTAVQENAALVLRLHGGGWVFGNCSTEEVENLRLGNLTSCVVVSVGYRL